LEVCTPTVFIILLVTSFGLFIFWFWYASAYGSKKIIMFDMREEEMNALLDARRGMEVPEVRRRPPWGWKRGLYSRRDLMLICEDGVWASFGLPKLVPQVEYGDNVVMMTRTEFHPWSEISAVFMAYVERELMNGTLKKLAALQFETRDLKVAVEADSIDMVAGMMAVVRVHAPHLGPDPDGPKIMGMERLTKGPGIWPWTILGGNAYKHTLLRETFPEDEEFWST